MLAPISGVLDILDNYAFVRTTGYLPGTNDVYVSLAQVKKYNLRKGDHVLGAIRVPREVSRTAASVSTRCTAISLRCQSRLFRNLARA